MKSTMDIFLRIRSTMTMCSIGWKKKFGYAIEERDRAVIMELKKRVAALEAEIADHRALNEELFLWFESDYDGPISETMAKAIERFGNGKILR
jgi:hypothetical protein